MKFLEWVKNYQSRDQTNNENIMMELNIFSSLNIFEYISCENVSTD